MFSAFFIDRPKFALVISIVITLAGLIALSVLPVEEFPEVVPPQVQVTADYSGANATAVEQSVAAPIEDKVNGVDDMLYMSSDSNNDGSYTLTVTFDVGTNPDIAAVNVQNRVATATAQLPSEVTRSGVTTKKQSSGLLMVIGKRGGVVDGVCVVAAVPVGPASRVSCMAAAAAPRPSAMNATMSLRCIRSK